MNEELIHKLLKLIAKYSIYSFQEIKKHYDYFESIDLLIEAAESAPQLNISLDMALMSSPIKIVKGVRK